MDATDSPPEKIGFELPASRVRHHPITIWLYCALLITTIVLSLILLVVIVAHKNLRKRVFNQLVATMALAIVIFNLFIRPGTIQDEDGTYEMNMGYCRLYLLLQKVEWFFMPILFWMMSIERLMALREPENYFKKMTNAARTALIAVPWCYAIVFAVVTIFILGDQITTRLGPQSDDPDFKELAHHVQIQCMVLYTHGNEELLYILVLVFGIVIPVLALSASGIALFIISIRRRNIKVYDSEGEMFIATESIVLCHLLNLSVVLMLLLKVALASVAFFRFVNTHYWSLVELVAVILAMSVLPDVRQVMGEICRCKKPDAERHALLGVSKKTQTQDEKVEAPDTPNQSGN